MTSLSHRIAHLLESGTVPWERDARPHVEIATVDAITAFAIGTGDDNPLFADPLSAKRSVHGGLIAPPLFLLATGTPPAEPGRDIEPDLVEALRTGVRIVTETWRFFDVVRPGDRLVRDDRIERMEWPNPRDPAVFDLVQVTTWSLNGHEVGERVRRRRHGEPPRPRRSRCRSVYRESEIEAIEAMQLEERRRGSNTRTGAEVKVGEDLPVTVRGPLTTTDLVTYRAVVGQGPLRSGVLRLRTLARRAEPALFTRDRSGVWDTIERLHWDDGHAVDLGMPGAYDYSHMRTVWLSQVLTDWAGDGGHLRELSVERLQNNHVGDTQWIRGRVAERRDLPGGQVDVTVDLVCLDQLDAVSFRGTAILRLPPRSSGISEKDPSHRNKERSP